MKNRILSLVTIIAAVAVIRLGLGIWSGQGQGQMVSVDGGYREVMGTIAHIVAVAQDQRDARRCIEAGFDQLNQIDEMMSTYKTDSQLSRVNRDAYKEPVKVDDALFDVLTEALGYSEKTKGAFDVTIGPLVALWREAEESEQIPTDERIGRARAKIGYEKLILNAEDKTVRFAVEGMQLDLSGIAKGYAVDKAVEAMQRTGAAGGLVDAGGDIRCFGPSTRDTRDWVIGLQDPQSEGKILLKLKLRDMAVATSGDYRRFVLIDGQKYSHIKDPATGSEAKDFSSVSIIAPTAIEADALATAVSVLGQQKGMELIESLAPVEAILILATDPGQNLILTTGAGQFIQKSE